MYPQQGDTKLEGRVDKTDGCTIIQRDLCRLMKRANRNIKKFKKQKLHLGNIETQR